MASDGAEVQRALVVQLLHQLIDIKARAQVARGLFDYACRSVGMEPDSHAYTTPVSLDLTQRAMDEAVASLTSWLRAQVIGLYDPVATTNRIMDDTAPR